MNSEIKNISKEEIELVIRCMVDVVEDGTLRAVSGDIIKHVANAVRSGTLNGASLPLTKMVYWTLMDLGILDVCTGINLDRKVTTVYTISYWKELNLSEVAEEVKERYF